MKKILVFLLALAMTISMFSACGAPNDSSSGDTGAETNNQQADEVSGLTAAKNYLYMMYKDSAEVTMADFVRVGVVKINGVTYTVEWTADSDTINIVYGDDKMVTIDIDEKNPEELTYTLTATLKDETGATETVSFTHRVPAAIIIDDGMTYEQIVDAAYALEDGMALEETFRLFGTIVKIDTPWSADYQNITVTIQIGDMSDKLIMCYRLKGEGAATLAVGDAITVEGILKNYKGTIEFDAGCVLVGMGEVVDQSALLDAAYALEDGMTLPESCTMTGVISKIDTAYSEDYKNITVTMIVGGDAERPIMCYRLKGEGAKELAIGDTITVTGTIKNYKGTIEFDAGCTLDVVIKGAAVEEPDVDPTPEEDRFADLNMSDAAAVVKAAYTLESGESMTKAATLTGVIKTIDTAYSEQYGNITVTIQIGDMADKLINCYRLKGNGADTLAVGDTVTVTGTLTNYNGKIQFGAGCTLDAVTKGNTDSGKTEDEGAKIDMNDPTAVVNAAYALEPGASLAETATLTGMITRIDTAWSDQHQNITVTILVGEMVDKPIMCYRLKGSGAKTLAVGDTITVTGTLKNYNGTIEFDAGCTLAGVVTAEKLDLEKFFDDFMAKVEEKAPGSTPMMMPADADVLDAYYPGLAKIATKQCVVRIAAISAVPAEFALIECANAGDVEAVKAILEARIAYQIDGGAFYPETIEVWKNARVIVRGNYVALILLGNMTDTLVEAYENLFN